MRIRNFLLLSCLAATATVASAQRFAVLSDIHITPGNKADSMLTIAVGDINHQNFDAVIINGDLTNEGSDEQLANVKAKLDAIRHPLHVLPGNHEDTWSQSATHTFPHLWGDDRFCAVYGNTVIAGVNCGPYMKMGDGHIKQEDLVWLKHTLDSLCTPGRRFLSFCHYPIQKDDLDNYVAYQKVIERYPTMAHINGHYHANKHYDIGAIPGVMLRSFIPSRTPGFQYSIVEVDGDKIKVYDKPLKGVDPVLRYTIDVADTEKRMVKGDNAPQKYDLTVPGFEISEMVVGDASIFTRLGFDEQNFYFANSVGQIVAMDKNTGAEKWTINTDATIFSRPVPLNSDLVAMPYHAGIFLIDKNRGEIVDTLAADKATPYVADGLIANEAYIQGGYKRLECRDPRTGKLIWEFDDINNYLQAAPTTDGKNLVFGAWDTYLRNVDPATGELRWKWNNGSKANMLGPGNVVPAITNGRVYIVAPDRYMTAIDLATGRQLWRNKSHRYRESMGISADGTRIYAKTMDGELAVIDATVPEFKEVAIVDLGLGYEHAPCVIEEVDDVIYLGSRRGIITAVSAPTLEVLWQKEVGVSEVNGIDVDPATGSVWASLIEGKVVRIDKK